MNQEILENEEILDRKDFVDLSILKKELIPMLYILQLWEIVMILL